MLLLFEPFRALLLLSVNCGKRFEAIHHHMIEA
jgi:hypothetical protein